MKRLFHFLILISVVTYCFAESNRLTIDGLTYYHYTGSGATVIRASKSGVVKRLEPLAEVIISGVTYPLQYVGNNGNSTNDPASFGEYLESAILPSSVIEITGFSFQGCSKLTELYLPDALTTIGGYAFENCSSLKELILPANVSSIGRTYAGKAWPAFSGMSSLDRYVSFGTAALDDKVGINASTDIYIIPGTSVSSKYKDSAKYIFSKTITPLLGGAKLEIAMNYDDFVLKSVVLNGQEIEKNDKGQYFVQSLTPESEYNFIANIEYRGRIYSVNLPFKTLTPSVDITFSKTQTTVTGKANIREDESLKPENVVVKFNGVECTLDENNKFTITNLIPATEYKYNIQAEYNGKLYYKNDKVTTSSVSSTIKSEVTPTSIKLLPTYNVGDAEYVSDYVKILEIDKYIDLESYLILGLDPETTYKIKHTILVRAGAYNSVYEYSSIYQIKTDKLTLETQEAVVTSTSSARLNGLTNATDGTGFGFEWRRIESHDLIPSTRVSSPVVNGNIIGSLRNVNPDVYYKYRPYYEASSGNIYFGEWVGFFTGDANIYYEPELTTFEIKTTADSNYIAEGIVIEGTDEIIEQGFEYGISDKIGFNPFLSRSADDIKHVVATGTYMTAILSDLKPNSAYTLRTYAITSHGITYGNEVKFETNSEAGCEKIISDDENVVNIVGYYNINGIKKDTPHDGLNIVIYSDGSTRKIIFGNYFLR